MKRTIDAASDSSAQQATNKKAKSSPADFMFEDSNYCRCSFCGQKTQKPALSQVATEWFMVNHRLLYDAPYEDREFQANIHKLVQPNIPLNFVKTCTMQLLQTKYSDDAFPTSHRPIASRIPKRMLFPVMNADQDFFKVIDSTTPPGYTIDYELQDGTYLEKSAFLKQMEDLSETNPTMVVDNNDRVLRFGELVSRVAVSNYHVEFERVKPVHTEFLPINYIFAMLQFSRCCESIAWFKSDFYETTIEDHLVDFNMIPDFIAYGFKDLWSPVTGRIKTVPHRIIGICEDKLDFLDTSRSHRTFPLLEPKLMNRITDARSGYDCYIEDTTFPDGSYNDRLFKKNLMREVALSLRQLDESTHESGEVATSIPQTFNVYHATKDWVHIPHFVDFMYHIDIDDAEIVQFREKDLEKFEVTDRTDTKQVVMERMRDIMRNCHVVSHIKWTSTKNIPANHHIDILDYKLENSYLPRSGAHWGTHRVYCHDCMSDTRIRNQLDYSFVHKWPEHLNPPRPNIGFNHPVNYNFFFEMYRALPMRLRPSTISNRFPDIEIVCQ